jgi:MOSC domain-containing protein YiiM
MSAKVLAVCVSARKGERKTPVQSAYLAENHGIIGDSHAGVWHRQVSLLAVESVRKMQALGLDVSFGDFAENITTEGIDLASLPLGTHLEVGDSLLEITQIGKECHSHCAIYRQAGDCVMPREGVFARVILGGRVVSGTPIKTVSLPQLFRQAHSTHSPSGPLPPNPGSSVKS